MNRRELYSCLCILIIATGIGLLIVIMNNTIWTQLLFVVIEVVALCVVVYLHRKNNIYYCMGCGQRVKIGLIPDIESPTLENGDKILHCKNCNKKINFRQCEPEEVVIIKEREKTKTEEVVIVEDKREEEKPEEGKKEA